VAVVGGELDEDGISAVDQLVLTIGGFKVGLISSPNLFPIDDIMHLAVKQRGLDVDILVHVADSRIHDGCFYLDPGSGTGAFTWQNPTPIPSFILLNVQGTTAVAYIYTLGDDGTIAVRKEKFAKEDE
jgi:predicted phosphodiesterase